MASPRNNSHFTQLILNYLSDIHRRDPQFFKNLTEKPQVNGRLFFDLTLSTGDVVKFPSDNTSIALLKNIHTNDIDAIDNPRLTYAFVDAIQRTAADIFSLIRQTFFLQLGSALTPAELDKLHRLIAGALCYKIRHIKPTEQAPNIVKEKIVAAVLSSPDDASVTLNNINHLYSRTIANKFTTLSRSFTEYLSKDKFKFALTTIANYKQAIDDLKSNIEFLCLDNDNQYQLYRLIDFTTKSMKIQLAQSTVDKNQKAELNTALNSIPLLTENDERLVATIEDGLKSISKGLSIETSTPSIVTNKPSPRRGLTDAAISPRSAAAAAADTSVARSPSGFMSRNSKLQPRNTGSDIAKSPAASPRL